MKVKMLVSVAGAGYTLAPGDEHEFSAAEAKNMIEAGYAVPVAAEKPETAAKKTPAKETR